MVTRRIATAGLATVLLAALTYAPTSTSVVLRPADRTACFAALEAGLVAIGLVKIGQFSVELPEAPGKRESIWRYDGSGNLSAHVLAPPTARAITLSIVEMNYGRRHLSKSAVETAHRLIEGIRPACGEVDFFEPGAKLK
jgi:hypothetical protein